MRMHSGGGIAKVPRWRSVLCVVTGEVMPSGTLPWASSQLAKRMGSRPEYRIGSARHAVCHHGLNPAAAARFIGGAGVDALVDQLRLTGESRWDDRGQQGLVQLQSTCDGIAGMGERGDKPSPTPIN